MVHGRAVEVDHAIKKGIPVGIILRARMLMGWHMNFKLMFSLQYESALLSSQFVSELFFLKPES